MIHSIKQWRTILLKKMCQQYLGSPPLEHLHFTKSLQILNNISINLYAQNLIISLTETMKTNSVTVTYSLHLKKMYQIKTLYEKNSFKSHQRIRCFNCSQNLSITLNIHFQGREFSRLSRMHLESNRILTVWNFLENVYVEILQTL